MKHSQGPAENNGRRFSSALSGIVQAWTALSRFDKYNAVTGTTGLVLEIVSLIYTFTERWTRNAGEDQAHAPFLTITGLVIPYVWLMLAWTLTRNGLNRVSDEDYRRQVLSNYVGRSVIGLGFFLAPLVLVWYRAAFLSIAEFDILIGGVPTLLVYLILGGVVYVSIKLLMPLCYNDLAAKRVRVLRLLAQRPLAALTILKGANAGKVFRFTSQIMVGRDPQFCDLPLYDEYVTNPHFFIQMKLNGFFITDKGSTNGTRVNGMPIPPQQPVLLQPDAIIEVGSTRLQFKRYNT